MYLPKASQITASAMLDFTFFLSLSCNAFNLLRDTDTNKYIVVKGLLNIPIIPIKINTVRKQVF